MPSHRVGCTRIERLAENLFEIFTDHGSEISLEDCLAFDQFWDQTCQQPFDLLIDGNREFSYSFDASLVIGSHPLQRYVAVYATKNTAQMAQQAAVSINQLQFPDKLVGMLPTRAEALAWLAQIRQRDHTEIAKDSKITR